MLTKKSLGACVIAGLAVLAVGGSLVSSSSYAQVAGPQGVGGGFGQAPGGLRGQGGPVPGMGPGFGGPAVMLDDNTHVYIFQGNRLFKVQKDNLLVNHVDLRGPRRAGEGRTPRGGGGGAGGTGGGGKK